MNYQESLDYLHELCKFGINLGLNRINKLLNLLGNPHSQIKTIHVAGTNGKGSTIAILANILQAAGLKVGVYTSPHLHSYTERIRINGVDISRQDFTKGMERLKLIVPEVLKKTGENPTEFEILTALAFNYFAWRKVDIAIIEVGMGGRLDSTNVLTPEISVLTSISTDHVDYLGSSLEDITREKAGIIKPGIPVVCSLQDEVVERVILEKAKKLNSPVYLIKDFQYEQTSFGSMGQRFNLITNTQKYADLNLSLLGDHQIENAITAITCTELLQSLGWLITEKHIYQGLATVKWAGRLEYLKLKSQVLLDGAHNPEGAQVLARAIPKFLDYDKLIMVLGVLEDKDKKEIINYLGPLGDVFIITKPPNSRAGDWQNLIELLKKYNKEVYIEADYRQAINLAFKLGQKNDLVCITGSLYLLGESREYVLNTFSFTYNK